MPSVQPDTVAAPEAALLELLAELATWAAQAAWRTAYAEGWADAEADMAASWRTLAEPIAHPQRGAYRRILAAIAGEREDQDEHERAFVARAYNTEASMRTDPQRAAVFVYPPPEQREARAT